MARGMRRRPLLRALGAAAVGITFGGALEGCKPAPEPAAEGPEEARLNFYNWDTYTGDTTLADFKKATGIDVNMSLFATNDELFAKLRAGNPGFDLIVPSNEFVTRMGLAGMLAPLDHAKIPNFKNIPPEFMDAPYDPGREYSAPYTWLVTGIGYRKSKVQGVPDSWKWLLDSDRYKGRIAVVSEAADILRIAAKYKGYSVNNISTAVMPMVEQLLIHQKPFIKAFHEDNGQDLLLSREVDLVMEFNGDIAQAMREDDDIGFVVPKEGSLLNADCLAIPASAPRPDNAHKFINFVLGAEAGAEIAKTILYPTPNEAARALMPESYRNSPVIFPPAAILAKCEYGAFESPDRSRMFEESFTRVRAA